MVFNLNRILREELANAEKPKSILKNSGKRRQSPVKRVSWRYPLRNLRQYTPNVKSILKKSGNKGQNSEKRVSWRNLGQYTPNRNNLNRFVNANMGRVYRQTSFNRVNVPGNGSCFYHAILLAGMGIRGGAHVRNLRQGVRQQLLNYYRNYRDNQEVAVSSNGRMITKGNFIQNLNKTGCFASQAEVMAAARVLGRRIVCLYASPTNNSTYRVFPNFTVMSYTNTLNSRNSVRLPPENPIYLYYNGYLENGIVVPGNHFEALIPKRS
jgi:hypothetical protein